MRHHCLSAVLFLGLSLTVMLVTGVAETAGALAAVAPRTGELDPAFGQGGKLTASFGHDNDAASAVAVQVDGKILAAGWGSNGSAPDFALARYHSNGSPDTSFGSGGQVLTPIIASSGNDYANGIAVQPDGKILVAGRAYEGIKLYSSNFVLLRYNNNGSLDTTFDGDGKVTTDFARYEDGGAALLLQPDGKIVVAGYATVAGNYDFAVARYNSNGSLDTSFDGDGKLTTNFGRQDYGLALARQTDGKIVVAGYSFGSTAADFAVARYNSNGSLDTTFDGDGKVTTSFPGNVASGRAITIQPDGKIIVIGTATLNGNSDWALARYNSDGSLDPSFGAAGKVTTDLGSLEDSATTVALLPSGKLLVAGACRNSSSDFALGRYNADGSLDAGFGTGGKVTTDFDKFSDRAAAMTVQPDGKIVLAGSTTNYLVAFFALARYLGDGSALATPTATATRSPTSSATATRSPTPTATRTATPTRGIGVRTYLPLVLK
jgi:uncharacterized delta-60 repeat protein